MRKDKSSIPSRLICALVASVVTAMAMPASAQTIPSLTRPQLVIGITVEGLDDDHLRLLNHLFTNDGFRRLMREGVTFENVDYGPQVDATAATAILFTGAAPTVNGITSGPVYNPITRQQRSSFFNTKENRLSPSSILVSTLADEVRLDGGGTGFVYSLSANPEEALIMAGHAGNSAYWIDDVSGRWTTTQYYNDTPQPITGRNFSNPLTARIDTMEWKPMLPPSQYPDVSVSRKNRPFDHRFLHTDPNLYKAFKSSPRGNQEITEVAEEYLTQMTLGKRGVMDMLNLSYSVAPYAYAKDDDTRFEMFDSYLRLDRDLERLFKLADNQVGRENLVIFLVGTPAPSSGRRPEERWQIPQGQFSGRKASSLLNMYLMALHGHGDGVSGQHARNFYLNHDLIKERQLDLSDVRAEAAEFLTRMSGVSTVYTVDDIIASRAGDDPAAMKRNVSVTTSGDVIVEINPGWELIDDDMDGFTLSPTRHAANISSAYIFAPGVSPEKIKVPTDARVIAPTVARLLRIRSPNAASLPPHRL